MTLEPGSVFAEWRICAEIGSGGIGTVYAAENAAGERIALKVFSLDHGNVEFLRKRFLAEGRILASLDHPRIVRVRTCGIETASGLPYLALDLVRSASGKVRTLEDERRDGLVSEARAWAWYRDLRAALEYCHAHGVIHRDLKLENALVDESGHAVITDFGIARIEDERKRREFSITTTFIEGETTGTRPVMGTYWYLAPELRRGGAATPASDRYALGVLFFRLLTGLWYEPGTKAFDLLAPCGKAWRELIPALLSDDPARRVFPENGIARIWQWRRMWILSGAFLLMAVASVIFWPTGKSNGKYESARPLEREKPEKPLEPAKPVELAKPVEPVKPVERTKPVEPVKPVELAKSVERMTDEPKAAVPPGNLSSGKLVVTWDEMKKVLAPFGSDRPQDAKVRLEFAALPATGTGGRWIAVTPVSRRLYAASVRFVGSNGQDLGDDDSPQAWPGVAHAMSFCSRFTGVHSLTSKADMKPGEVIRLPTKEELGAAVAAGILSADEVAGETVATGMVTFGTFGSGKPTGRFRLCIGKRL